MHVTDPFFSTERHFTILGGRRTGNRSQLPSPYGRANGTEGWSRAPAILYRLPRKPSKADPFGGLKKPIRQFGMRDLTDAQGQLRPSAFQCNPAPQLPYALVVGPGKRAILVMP